MTQKFTERYYQTASNGENVGPSIAKLFVEGSIKAFLLTENNDPIVAGNKFASTESAESPGPIPN
jgi:hypothetical protein